MMPDNKYNRTKQTFKKVTETFLYGERRHLWRGDCLTKSSLLQEECSGVQEPKWMPKEVTENWIWHENWMWWKISRTRRYYLPPSKGSKDWACNTPTKESGWSTLRKPQATEGLPSKSTLIYTPLSPPPLTMQVVSWRRILAFSCWRSLTSMLA